MASKSQKIYELSQDTAKGLSGYQSWTAFLRSAAWQYKYPFEDQLLIYAQRPDATACASLEVWNNKLHRWINRGAKGIALLREQGGQYALDYVFDVKDTNSFYGNEVKLWKHDEKYDDLLIETLENTFGTLEVTATLTDAIICAAHNAVQDNKADYLQDLNHIKYNSFLDDLDELNVDVEFQQTAEMSVAYMILERLGLSPGEFLEQEEFSHIVDFNTPETLAILGNAVSSISEQALRNISETIRTAERSEKQQSKFFAENNKAVYTKDTEKNNDSEDTERMDEHGRSIDLQTDGRLSDTQPDIAGNEANREIRNDEINLPQEQPQEPLLRTDDNRETDGASGGNGQNSERTDTDDSRENGENGGHNRSDESQRSAEVDRADEQFTAFGGGK